MITKHSLVLNHNGQYVLNVDASVPLKSEKKKSSFNDRVYHIVSNYMKHSECIVMMQSHSMQSPLPA
jgi:hypothetical protein